jgi:hypothetical protein
MRYIFTAIIIMISVQMFGQTLPPPSPCIADKIYRQFDFWLGEWEAYNPKGKKAGDSKISLILDSCIVFEEWTNVTIPGVGLYKGKSFNTYDASSKQWQQTWVDNVGGSTHYTLGKFDQGKMIFQTSPSKTAKDTIIIMKLSFFDLGPDKVRQLGEISKDNGQTWSTQYDLEYRRKK